MRHQEYEKQIERKEDEIEILLEILAEAFPHRPYHRRRKPKHHPHRLAILKSINNSIFELMNLTIASNQNEAGILGLVDEVTNQPVTGTFTGVTASSDTPAAATVAVDADNDINVTAVAAGSGNITVTALCAFTDSTGAAQAETLTATIPFTITEVVTADAVALVVNFGNPTAQTAPATPPAPPVAG